MCVTNVLYTVKLTVYIMFTRAHKQVDFSARMLVVTHDVNQPSCK